MSNIQTVGQANEEFQRLLQESFRRLQQQTPNGSIPTFGSVSRGTPHPNDVLNDALSTPRGQQLQAMMNGYGGGAQSSGGYSGGRGGSGGGFDLATLMQMAQPAPQQEQQQPGFNPYQPYQQGFGPGGYGYPMPPDPLELDFQRKMDQANAANEARYNEARQGYGDLRTRVMDRIGDLGSYQRDDTNRAFNEKSENVKADLASRGLLGSTVLGSVQRGVERERNDALRRVEDDILNRQIGADERTTGNLLGLVERRNDVGPNYDQLIQLRQALGQGGYSGGAGYAGNMYGGAAPTTNYNTGAPVAYGSNLMRPRSGGGGLAGAGGMASAGMVSHTGPKAPAWQGAPGNTAEERWNNWNRLNPGPQQTASPLTPGFSGAGRSSYPTPVLPPSQVPPASSGNFSSGPQSGYGGYQMPPDPRYAFRPWGSAPSSQVGVSAKAGNPVQMASQDLVMQMLRMQAMQQGVPQQQNYGGGGGIPSTYLPSGGGMMMQNGGAPINAAQSFGFNIPGQSYGMYGVGTGSTYDYTQRPDMTGANQQYANRFQQPQVPVVNPPDLGPNRPYNPKYNNYV